MKLALVLGSQGEKLKSRFRDIKDNLRIDSFVNIPAFIDSSIKRDELYDRVVVLSTLVDSVKLRDLHNFWDSYCKDTEMVFLCKEGSDNDLASKIMNTFVSTRVSTMLVKSTTIQILCEAVLLPTKEITEKYGIEKFMEVSVSDGVEVDLQLPEEQVQEQEVQTQQVQQSVQAQQQQVKKEKKSLFGSLFGGKKKKQQGVPVQVQGDYVEQGQEQVNSGMQSEEVPEEEFLNDDNQENNDFIDTSQDYESSNETSQFADFGDNADEGESYDLGHEEEPAFNEEDQQSSKRVYEKPQVSQVKKGLTAVANETSDFEPDDIELDFGDSTFDVDATNPIIGGNTNGIAEEVDVEGEVLGDYEGEYRSKDAEERVVVKTITKEVVRHVGGKVNTTLNGIWSGRLHKTIIVTGDRGSGVTVTAYTLARKFAEKVPVLYVDFDIERKGILSYIDYETFVAYDNSMREGVKRCRDSNIFSNCVVQYDTHIDILTSDYSCECTDDDIQRAEEVVAENAMSYGVVVVDCPIEKLHLITDLILTGNTVLCMECSKRGVMNMLCGLENSTLSLRYKRTIVSRGTLLVTKLNPKVKSDKVLRYADSIFQADGCDWLRMEKRDFNGKMTNEILIEIVEG